MPILIVLYVVASIVAAFIKRARTPPRPPGPYGRSPRPGERPGAPGAAGEGPARERLDTLPKAPEVEPAYEYRVGERLEELSMEGELPGRVGPAQAGAPVFDQEGPFDGGRSPHDGHSLDDERSPYDDGSLAPARPPFDERPLDDGSSLSEERPLPKELSYGGGDWGEGEQAWQGAPAPAQHKGRARDERPAAAVRRLLTPDSLAQAVLLKEILGPPRALEPYRPPAIRARRRT